MNFLLAATNVWLLLHNLHKAKSENLSLRQTPAGNPSALAIGKEFSKPSQELFFFFPKKMKLAKDKSINKKNNLV